MNNLSKEQIAHDLALHLVPTNISPTEAVKQYYELLQQIQTIVFQKGTEQNKHNSNGDITVTKRPW